jgi:hypothetical protein
MTGNATWDFGFAPIVSIEDRVWLDANGDGVRAVNGDVGIAGVVVELLDSNNTIVGDTTTNNDGVYVFESRSMPMYTGQQYAVRIARPQNVLNSVNGALQLTLSNVGNDADDNDANNDQQPSTPTFTLPSNGKLLNSNSFGFRLPPALGDYVFNDNNANGIQDAGDTPLAGVLVELVLSDRIITKTTDVNGKYTFLAVDQVLTSTNHQLRIRNNQTQNIQLVNNHCSMLMLSHEIISYSLSHN